MKLGCFVLNLLNPRKNKNPFIKRQNQDNRKHLLLTFRSPLVPSSTWKSGYCKIALLRAEAYNENKTEKRWEKSIMCKICGVEINIKLLLLNKVILKSKLPPVTTNLTTQR